MFDPPKRDSDSEGGGRNWNHDMPDSGRAGTSSLDVDDEKTIQQRKDLNDLATWFAGLNYTSLPLTNPVDLCTGRAFAEILHSIDKNHFNDAWLDSIAQYTSDANAVVKRSNLRKLWRKILDLIHSLGREVASKRWHGIADNVDGSEETDLPIALNFSMIIVTLAHVGKTKEDYIDYSRIFTNTNASIMQNVARMITLILNELPESSNEIENEQNQCDESDLEFNVSTSERSFRAAAGRSSLSESPIVAKLYEQIEEKDSELIKVKKDMADLKKQLEAEALKSEGSKSCTSDSNLVILEQMNEELKAKKREAEEKVNELESQLEYLKPVVQELKNELERTKSAQKEVQPLKAELQSVKDELFIWKDRAQKAEIDSELLKSKDRENKELTSQVKMLNTRIEHFVKQSTSDEDTKNGILNLRQMIGKLKGENDAKDMDIISKQQTITKLEDELISTKEKVKSLDDRKEELILERNSLQERLIKASEQVNERSLRDSIIEAGNTSFENSTSERTKLELEVENQRLMERVKELEALEPLQGEIKTLKSRNGVLEEDYQLAIKQRNDIQKEMEELQQAFELSKQNVSGDVVELKVKLERTSLDLERANETAKKATSELRELEDTLKKKTVECESYIDSLNKSKSIVIDLERKAKPVGTEHGTSVQQFRELEKNNKDLEEKVLKLQQELKTVIATSEQESRLLTSSAHKMVLDRPSESFYENPDRRAVAGGESSTTNSANTSTSSVPTSASRQSMSSAISWRYE